MKNLMTTVISLMLTTALIAQEWEKLDSLNYQAPSDVIGGNLLMRSSEFGIIYGTTGRAGYTNDGGYTWNFSNGIPSQHTLNYVSDFDGLGLYGITNKGLPYESKIIKSSDNGQTWTTLRTFNNLLGQIYRTSSPAKYFMWQQITGSGGGSKILVSDDLNNWSTASIDTTQSYVILGTTNTKAFVLFKEYIPSLNKTQTHCLRFDANLNQWDTLDIGSKIGEETLQTNPQWGGSSYTNGCIRGVAKDNVLLVQHNSGNLYKSTDEGETWTQLTSLPSPIVWSTNPYNLQMKIIDENHFVFFNRQQVSSNGEMHTVITETTNGGISWSNSLGAFQEPYLANVNISSLNYLNTDTYGLSSASISGYNIVYIWRLGNSLGMDEIDFSDTATPYPNPFSSEINLKNVPANLTYRISDLSGKIVDSGLTKSTLSLAHLENGMYVLAIEGYEVKRIVKK